eukprot:TRINITY_DN53595_c0_g1_i1.p1 TRINITY_DN53595_c0_g1~~TRINITY_DN53595_c0_g1_i1.p1  ORF type:complete len:176 (-),score=24.81 TRINITY_DN53595_c0_g1_i1:11-505(-)
MKFAKEWTECPTVLTKQFSDLHKDLRQKGSRQFSGSKMPMRSASGSSSALTKLTPQLGTGMQGRGPRDSRNPRRDARAPPGRGRGGRFDGDRPMDIGPVMPLEKSEHRYDPRKTGEGSDWAKLVKQLNGYLNKLTVDKFERLSGEIGRAVQQECRDRSRMPSSA